jgi:hypothetical protein
VLSWNDHAGPVPNRTEQQLLTLTREKARKMGERRRRRAGAAMTSACLAIGLAVLVGTNRPAETTLQTVSGEPGTRGAIVSPTTRVAEVEDLATTASSSTAASTAVQSTIPPSTERPTASVAATRPAAVVEADEPAPSTTTTALLCQNSFDPACGAFRWDPPPGPNQPLTASVSASPASPKAGEPVTFRIRVEDPDGSRLLDRTERTVDYGDGTPFGGTAGHGDCAGGTGPWTPPPPVPVHEELVFQHAYVNPGTYTVTVSFKALGNCAYPASEGTATTTVVVTRGS